MSEHLLFLAFPLLFPPLMYKVLNFIHVKKFFSFINKEMEGELNDLNFKILERIEKETNQVID